MYRIGKVFRFEASHTLTGLPEGHQCSRLHGHSYSIEVELQAEALTGEGWVRDYGELDRIKDYIANTLDHRHINSVIAQPTAENMAHTLYDLWYHWYPELTSVTVRETPGTYAVYAPCRAGT